MKSIWQGQGSFIVSNGLFDHLLSFTNRICLEFCDIHENAIVFVKCECGQVARSNFLPITLTPLLDR